MSRGRMDLITSFSNDRIKMIRSLDLRKGRRAQGLFVAEGAAVVLSARDRGRELSGLVVRVGAAAESNAVQQAVTWALDSNVDVMEVPGALLEKMTAKDNPQAVLGLFPIRFAELPTVNTIAGDATWLALEEVRDPGNLGTIIRTAHAAGVAGIILAGTCCDPHQRECVRASMGSIFAVPLVSVTRDGLLDLMADWPGDTIATDLRASADFRSVQPRGPELIVMGREGPGLTEAVAAACQVRVRIPMVDDIDSLNLAIATALMIYEVRKSRFV